MNLRSRHTSGRSSIFPEGNDNYFFVKKGNVLWARCALLIVLACSMGSRVILEQPFGSIIDKHPRFKWLVQTIYVLFLII